MNNLVFKIPLIEAMKTTKRSKKKKIKKKVMMRKKRNLVSQLSMIILTITIIALIRINATIIL